MFFDRLTDALRPTSTSMLRLESSNFSQHLRELSSLAFHADVFIADIAERTVDA
jgi:hypothetical protein